MSGATANTLSDIGMGSVPLFSSVSLAAAGAPDTATLAGSFLAAQSFAVDSTVELLRDVGGKRACVCV